MLEELPALRVDSARAEELYAEGKCVVGRVDGTVLVRMLLEKRTELPGRLLGHEVYVPASVLEETLSKIIMLGLEEETGSNRFYELKEAFEKGKELPEALMQRIRLLNLVKDGFIVLGIDEKVFDEAKKISVRYRLLPNDALVVAAARLHGIQKIATLDNGFERRLHRGNRPLDDEPGALALAVVPLGLPDYSWELPEALGHIEHLPDPQHECVAAQLLQPLLV